MKFRMGRRTGMAVTAVAMGAASLLVSAGPAAAWVDAPNIRYGATGEQALCVQVGIDSMDNNDIYTYPDGQFGPDTLRAVKKFQAYWGLQQDGVVGRDTGTKMLEMMILDGKRNGNDYSWHWRCQNVLPRHP
ncbi:peptidoglycan-binding protein [Streptomyces sp. NPDC050504]|uniref:peptidoglycan-binding protein n=1 Tax=Streptomyces sp. NPDC050504 TaxID=3365618 RepID=UPI0037BDFA21